MLKLKKIISGCQTGADQGGLEAAEALGIDTGGWMTKGYRTEDGPRPDLLERFNLQEHHSWGYPARTHDNIKDSDGTVIFGRTTEGGTSLTLELCRHLRKPHIANPEPEEFIAWLIFYEIEVLNVAGNRESKCRGIQKLVKGFIITAYTHVQKDLFDYAGNVGQASEVTVPTSP